MYQALELCPFAVATRLTRPSPSKRVLTILWWRRRRGRSAQRRSAGDNAGRQDAPAHADLDDGAGKRGGGEVGRGPQGLPGFVEVRLAGRRALLCRWLRLLPGDQGISPNSLRMMVLGESAPDSICGIDSHADCTGSCCPVARRHLQTDSNPHNAPSGLLGWSSFFFALLQSVCTFFIAVSGLRLLIGITSLTVSAGLAAALDRFHVNWIRIPMIALALAGALLNLVVLAQVRYLRSRPASRWRIKPPSLRALRMERIQFVLSIATMILIGLEEYFHIRHSHTL